RGNKIDPDVLASIAGTDLDTGRTLDLIASAPASRQSVVLEEERTKRQEKAALREKKAAEAKRENRTTDSIVKDRRIDAVTEWLAKRLDVDEWNTLGEMPA